MKPIIIATLLYVVILPLTIFAIARLHRLFFVTLPRRRARKKKVRLDVDSLPKPLTPRMMARVKFAIKDKRGLALSPKKSTGIQNRWVFFGLYLSGLVCAIVASLLMSVTFALVSLFLGILTLLFALQSADKAIKKRNEVVERIAEMAGSHFKISRKKDGSPDRIVKVDKWTDYTRPAYVRIFSSRPFEESAQDSFLYEFNKAYGKIRTWVADTDAPETQGTGWDHESGVGYLKSKPPLPESAPWHEGYVLNPGIAWSFFPLALGLEDGVEMPDPVTGDMVNVLGFDLSGNQKKVGKEAGLKVAKIINTTPQVFIGGSTGGGKAHPVDTEVVVYND